MPRDNRMFITAVDLKPSRKGDGMVVHHPSGKIVLPPVQPNALHNAVLYLSLVERERCFIARQAVVLPYYVGCWYNEAKADAFFLNGKEIPIPFDGEEGATIVSIHPFVVVVWQRDSWPGLSHRFQQGIYSEVPIIKEKIQHSNPLLQKVVIRTKEKHCQASAIETDKVFGQFAEQTKTGKGGMGCAKF